MSVGRKALACVWGPCRGGTGLGGHRWSEQQGNMSVPEQVTGGRMSPWAALPGASGDGIWVSFPSFLPSVTTQCPSQRGGTSSNDTLSGGRRCSFICVEKYVC